MPGNAGKYYEAVCPECGEIYRVYGGGPGKCDECGWDQGRDFMESLGIDKSRQAVGEALKKPFWGE